MIKRFEEIITETPATISTLDSIAMQAGKLLKINLKKINTKEIKGDFESMRKFNVLQTALNSIIDNFK